MLTPRKVAQRDVVEVESPAALKVLASLSEAQAQAQRHTRSKPSAFSTTSYSAAHSTTSYSAAHLLAEAAAAADTVSTDASEYDENDDVDDREQILFTTDIANVGAERIKVGQNLFEFFGEERKKRRDAIFIFFSTPSPPPLPSLPPAHPAIIRFQTGMFDSMEDFHAAYYRQKAASMEPGKRFMVAPGIQLVRRFFTKRGVAGGGGCVHAPPLRRCLYPVACSHCSHALVSSNLCLFFFPSSP